MGPKRILIIGNYGAGNLGDDAILGGIITELHELGFNGQLAVTHGGFSSSPEIYNGLQKGLKKVPFVPSGLRSFFKWRKRREALKAIKAADMVILGGGGLFMDSESIKAPIIWAAQAKACRRMKTPYICFGQSIGPLKRSCSRFLTRRVFKKAVSVHVRDEFSAKILKKWGVKELSIGTDPALSWIKDQKSTAKKKKVIAVSLRQWQGIAQKEWELVIKEIKTFAKKKKFKPVLVAMDIRNTKEVNQLKDLALMSDIEFFEPPSARLALQGFQSASMAVTMRLHAGIFALSTGSPLLALSYSPKVEGFMDALKVSGSIQILDPRKLTPRKLKKALQSITKDKKKLKFNLETPLTENQSFLAHALIVKSSE